MFFISALHICFIEKNDTYQEKVLNFFTINNALMDYQFTTAFAFLPSTNGKLDSSRMIDAIENGQGNLYDLYNAANENSDNVNIVECVIAGNIFDMYFFELLEIFKHGITLSKCWFCGKFFIPKTKKTTLFCDRIVRDNRTCKQVGSKLKSNAEKENDKFLKEYDMLYNRYYTRAERYSYADLTNGRDKIEYSFDDFFAWSQMASYERKQYLAGEISGEELINRIRI